MLSAVFGRNSFTALRVCHWAIPPQSSLIWALTGASHVGSRSLQACGVSAAALAFTGRDAGSAKSQTPAVCRSVRPELLQRTGPHAARIQHLHTSAARLKRREQPEPPPPRELDLLRYDMRDLRKSPKPALYLGLAGLVPFVSPPLLMGVTEIYFPELAYAQLAYGASIVSFLGGARWGFALPESSPAKPDWINLANSVVPSLLAWAAVLFADNITTAAMLVIMGLGVSLHYDLALLPTYPSWFKALRALLTFVAVFSIAATLIMNGSFPEKRIFSDEKE